MITLRQPNRRDLKTFTMFVNELVEERARNPELGVLMDRIMTEEEEDKEYLSSLLQRLDQRMGVVVSAFDGERLVGNCEVTRRKQGDVKHTGVLGIAILEGYRNYGLGGTLIGTALKEAAAIGVDLVELEVFAINSRAIHLYESFGFMKAGSIPGKVRRRGVPIDVITMYLVRGEG